MSEKAKPVCAMATAHRCIFAYVAPGQHVCIAETIARNTQALMQSSAIEITALRAAHEALLRRTQSLETALDQERADNERLREYAQHTGAWCGQDMGHACTCGLSALLSGRGEGGNDG